MKITFHAGSSAIEVEGRDTKDCFTQIASAVEVFGHPQCGACKNTNITPLVRENAGNHYYELQCNGCNAALAFGQRKADGALYPRRKDKDGNFLPNNGWTKWTPRANDEPF